MNAMLPSFVSTLGWALIHFVWQGTLVGIATTIALMLLRNARPQVRYAVCCIALALCLALPIFGVLRGIPADMPTANATTPNVSVEATFATSAAPFDAASDQQVAAPLAAWRSSMQQQLPWIVALWSIGAGLLALRMALGMMWVGRIGRSSTSETHPRWQRRLDRLAEKMEIVCSVRLRVAADLASPVAAGCWRPVVLLPAALIANMPLDLVEALLAHELAHIKRHDYLVNLIQSAIESLLFYHPVVWWLSKQIRIEREQIADDLAVRAIGEPHRLALALHELDAFQQDQLQQFGEFPGAFHLVPAANGGHLMSRIQRLIRPNQHALSWKMALPIIGLTAVCLTVYAQGSASVMSKQTAATHVATAMPVVSTARTSVTTITTPTASEAPVIASVLATSAAPVARTATVGTRVIHDTDHRSHSFAIVHAGQDGMKMIGDSSDIPLVERARKRVHGDFIWVRRDGKTYVVQDPTVIASVEQAWKQADALGQRMGVLGKQMDIPGKRMDVLGKQMEALSGANSPAHAAMEETGAQMEALGRQQEAIGVKMETIGDQMEQANGHQREALQQQMQALQAQMQPLTKQMNALATVMDAHGKEMQAAQKPMEDLAKQMAEASKPMQDLGRQMDAMGKQEEQLVQAADSETSARIEAAISSGQAAPEADVDR